MTQLRFRLLSGAIAMIALLLAGAPAAGAYTVQGTEDCPSSRLCRWPESGFQGRMQVVPSSSTVINVSGTYSSLYVNRSGAVRLHSGSNGTGSAVCIRPGRAVSSLSGWRASPGSITLLSSGC
ncbi:Peptidase inhibitor family I36 [Quadrisphaera granulorum]|uniref:Peptidase inhibitor family I36 n=1 Tax=Quadrisphaera granulorum TaxID=317664 RepID=A0A316A9P9_9ACTN|nr:peptidase inhibitor family I36 protein [Quadrisphaera granulorum]PWJ53928.1 peptidase inhibitor family I36 [Quadrisphaera granulorum]SZE96385.1 Peptidase inhibitor family I36 [Quadrisphaera granulorum]